jgi:hypothetical protein
MKTSPFALAFLSFVVFAHAENISWTGTSNGAWDNPVNWDPQEIPDGNDSAIIGAVDATNKDLLLSDGAYSLTGLTFQNGGYTISANSGTPTLTLLGDSLVSQSSDDSENHISVDLILAAPTNTISVLGALHRLTLANLTANGPLTAQVNGADGCLEFSGTTSVNGALIKTGAGQLCITAPFSSTSTSIQDGIVSVEADSSLGDVTIAGNTALVIDMGATASAGTVESAGALIISEFFSGDGTLQASGGVTMQSGSYLYGAGTIEGNVTIMDGATLEGGAALEPAGMTILGNLTMDGLMRIQIIDDPILVGSITLDGDLNLSGTLCVCTSGLAGLYNVIEYTGELTGTFSGIINTLPDYNYELIYNDDAKAVQLLVTAVPEPSSAALVIGAALVLFRRRRN